MKNRPELIVKVAGNAFVAAVSIITMLVLTLKVSDPDNLGTALLVIGVITAAALIGINTIKMR